MKSIILLVISVMLVGCSVTRFKTHAGQRCHKICYAQLQKCANIGDKAKLCTHAYDICLDTCDYTEKRAREQLSKKDK
ncbi:MAG: hypothetical protein OEW60_02490 [Thiovulaceae bacterium]|nr:hypothetical protein [Sulfurimonadaceae bacterium]